MKLPSYNIEIIFIDPDDPSQRRVVKIERIERGKLHSLGIGELLEEFAEDSEAENLLAAGESGQARAGNQS